VAATDGDRLVGMLSVRQMDDADALDGFTPTNHVSIVIVDPEYRGRGIARDLYTFLIGDLPDQYRRPNVSTKTWSTNDVHIPFWDRSTSTASRESRTTGATASTRCTTRVPWTRSRSVTGNAGVRATAPSTRRAR